MATNFINPPNAKKPSMTQAEQAMHDRLSKVGLPFVEIRCYGRQITVVCIGFDTANKWASMLQEFSKLKCCKETIRYNRQNTNSVSLPSTYKAYLIASSV